MKVAFVLGTSTGGTARHVKMLAAGCAARGVQAEVLGPAQTDRDFAFGAGFTPVEIADRPRLARDLRAITRLRSLLRRSRPDVVHAHGLRAGALSAIALAFAAPRDPAARPALIVTVHNAPVAGGTTGTIYRVLELIVARNASLVLCVSADLEDRMRAAGARRVGRAVVPAPLVSLTQRSVSAETPAATRAGLAPARISRWCWPWAGWPRRKGSACCSRRPRAGGTSSPSRCSSSPARGRCGPNWPPGRLRSASR